MPLSKFPLVSLGDTQYEHVYMVFFKFLIK